MLTKDFIKAVEELGYGVDNEWPHILYVETAEEDPDIVVSLHKRKLDPPTWNECTLIPASDAVALFKLVKEYESTPLEERVAEEAITTKTLQEFTLEELGEAISKKILKECDPNVQVLISQERISFYEPKWSTPSEWALNNL